MTSSLDNLCGPGKPLHREVRNRSEYEGGLDIDDRIVQDLIDACKAVQESLEQLGPLEVEGR